MKCNQCSAEFEGAFCSKCGAKAEVEIQTTPVQEQKPTENNKPEKKKKPFFLKWWFILIVAITVGLLVLVLMPEGEKIVWEDMVLSEALPEPPANRGKIYENSTEQLWVVINDISDKEYAVYMESCKENGFNIDVESSSSTFDAYNKEGYKLSVSHYGDDADMNIQLDIPMEAEFIIWPVSIAGKQLPEPKSTKGKFEFEHEKSFMVHISETSKSDYAEYIKACSDKGFNIDFNKGENHYYAYNKNGWYLTLKYEGNNTMSIRIDYPQKEESTTEKKTEAEKTTISINSDFKVAMDSYEEFMNDYVDFMKKYKANPTDLTLISDYADYMSDYAKFMEDFEAWENEDLNTAELAYYVEVQGRVSKKLLEVAE